MIFDREFNFNNSDEHKNIKKIILIIDKITQAINLRGIYIPDKVKLLDNEYNRKIKTDLCSLT